MFFDKQVCWISNQWYQTRFSLRSLTESVTPETIEAMEIKLGDQILGISFFSNTIPAKRIVADSLFPWYDELTDSTIVASALARLSWAYLNVDVVMALIKDHIDRYIKPELARLESWRAEYDDERRRYWAQVDFLTGRLYATRVFPEQYEYIWREAYTAWGEGRHHHQTDVIHPVTQEPYRIGYFYWLRLDHLRGPRQSNEIELCAEACAKTAALLVD